jgi:hypothetical protein
MNDEGKQIHAPSPGLNALCLRLELRGGWSTGNVNSVDLVLYLSFATLFKMPVPLISRNSMCYT